MRTSLPIALLITTACSGAPGDGEDDSFGGANIKADGQYSSCQLAEVLKLVNESTTTVDSLKDLEVSDNAAEAIIAHRSGADGQAGTGDDDVYDDLNELDAVKYVGNLALGKLVYAILPRCENDLNDRPFIDDQTFTGPSGGWARDNEEVEAVLGVSGMTGQKLRSLLLQTNSSGRTLYDRLRKSSAMEAFTYAYALDEMPWDTDAQDAREQITHVALTIESGRYEPNEDGVRELSLGTDLMDDTYFDTHGYTLLGHDIELRDRARWDDATTVRRILIAAKFGTEVDANGNKINSKVDIRNDNGASFVPALDDDVRRGKTAWNGGDQPATPIRGVYEQLKAGNSLLEIGAHHGVLLLEAQAHLRSTRSRYHMNEATVQNLKTVYANATTRIQAALNQVAAARTAGIIPAGDVAAVNAMEAMGKAILDKSLLAQRITAAGVSVTATTLVQPDAQPQPTDKAGLDRNKIIAETISTVFHEFAAALDDTDRIITNAVDDSFDHYAEQFRAWRVSLDMTLARKTTYDTFLASYRQLATPANRATALAQFNAYGAAQRAANSDGFADFAPLDDAAFTRLEGYLVKMTLTVGEHQIETAGICGQQLWFDQARTLWVPASSRAFSNFMIDTTDMTDMLSNQEWSSVATADRTFAQPLPATKVFNTMLVNELQVELGMETAYVAREKDLEAKLAADPNNAALKEQLEGARFVWNEYKTSMTVLAQLKGNNILDKLKKAGAPSGIKWTTPPDSKGNIALEILSDRDS